MRFKKTVSSIAMATILLSGTTAVLAVEAPNFKDVPNTYWGYDSVKTMVDKGVVSGYPDGTFRPNEKVSRRHSAMFLARAIKLDLENPTKFSFEDFNPKTAGYAEAVALTELGAFAESDKFNPESPLTRAHMAKAIVESYNLKLANGNIEFTDVPKSDWASDYIQTLAAYGITTGKTKTTFAPSDPVTRVQFVSFLDRTQKAIAKNPSIVVKKTEDKTSPPTNNDSGDSIKNPPINNGGDGYAHIPDVKYEIMNKEFEAVFLSKLNDYRNSKGLNAVKISEPNNWAANFRSTDMSVNNYYDHTSPFYGPYSRILEHFNPNSGGSGEIIYDTFYYPNDIDKTAQHMLEGFIKSPGHNAIMLGDYYNYVGIGLQPDGEYLAYLTVIFTGK